MRAWCPSSLHAIKAIVLILCTWTMYISYVYYKRWDTSNVAVVLKSRPTDAPKLNSTTASDSQQRVVFYNRIGKCGSRSLISLLQMLSEANNYSVASSPDYAQQHPSDEEMRAEILKISRMKALKFYNRHIHFLDFKKFGFQEPIYINMIRDPIDRFSSQYNYLKYGDKMAMVKVPPKNLPDINECVMKGTSLCGTDLMFYMGLYFCGFDKTCGIKSASRVELAKKHISENYAVIGLTEEFNNTIALLERMMPEYFRGAVGVIPKLRTRETTATHRKETLSPESFDKLKNYLMKDEYEVYNHAKQKYIELKKKYQI